MFSHFIFIVSKSTPKEYWVKRVLSRHCWCQLPEMGIFWHNLKPPFRHSMRSYRRVWYHIQWLHLGTFSKDYISLFESWGYMLSCK